MAGISKADREALAEVKSKFDSVQLDESSAAVADTIRKSFAKLAVDVHRACPDGRNKSLAMTHLEDAGMRAIRALSHDTKSEAEVVETSVKVKVDESPEVVVKETKTRKPRSRRSKETVDA